MIAVTTTMHMCESYTSVSSEMYYTLSLTYNV